MLKATDRGLEPVAADTLGDPVRMGFVLPIVERWPSHAVVDALDAVPGLEGRARIKWVNDILIGDAKVAGILAYTQTLPTK